MLKNEAVYVSARGQCRLHNPKKPYPVHRYSDVYRQAKRNLLIELIATPSTQQRITFNYDNLKPHDRGPLRPGGPRLKWYQTTLLEYWAYLHTFPLTARILTLHLR